MKFVKLTAARENGVPTVWLNLERVFCLMVLADGATRVWSGDIAATTQPKVKSTDAGLLSVPFHIDVRESPDDIFSQMRGLN